MKRFFIYYSSLIIFSCNQHSGKINHTITTATSMQKTGFFNRPQWIHNTTIYEVNLRQFSQEGTLAAFAKELPRLKKMGMETLWFMPLTIISQQNKKGVLGSPYACSSYTRFNPAYGNFKEWAIFVKEAHAQGFKVIIDWVANHTGWDHEWTQLHPEYYIKDSATGNFKTPEGMDDIIELDYNNPMMRKAMIEAMRFWVLNSDIDGFRCDLAAWVPLNFWMEARTALEQNKNLFWLAEADALENPQYLQVFDASYSWSWMHETKKYFDGQVGMEKLDTLLLQYDTAGGSNNIPLWFTSNHDENSWNGTAYEKYGNLALPLAVFSFTWNGIPLVYNGQEIPNTKRLAFFEKDPIVWKPPYKLEEFYTGLSQLRKNNTALLAGHQQVTTYRLKDVLATKNLMAYLRKNDNRELLVLLNFGETPINIEFDNKLLLGKFKNIFNQNNVIDFSKPVVFNLVPYGYLIFEK